MASNDRVVWSEGLFLRPQHFQQQDRFLLAQISSSCQGLQSYRWGFQELEIDQDLLKVGKLALKKGTGILPDGSPFSLANNQQVLDLAEGTQDVIVYLCLPIARSMTTEFSTDLADLHVRYFIKERKVNDNTDKNSDAVDLQLGASFFRLYSDKEELDAFHTLPVAKIVEVGADRNVVLDESFIAPSLDSNQQSILHGYIVELKGMLHQRAQGLAGRVSGAGRSSTEISDFLLLQAINRFEPLVNHFATLPHLHPETLYQNMIQIAGEIATFTSKERRPPTFEQYKHNALAETFSPVINSLRQAMSTVLEQAATQIDISAPNQYGIRTAVVGNREMLKKALFVLAVRADVPDETLRGSLPGQMKIGAVDRIAQLINKSLPGVGISALPAAPRQIPFHAGTTYFQVDVSSAAWADITVSGNIAFHIAGQYPGMDITFWAVRQ
jgi:type VI secretion system protein ImpJ